MSSGDNATTTLEGFTAALVLNLVIAASAVLAFCLLRPYFPGIYAPRALRLCAHSLPVCFFFKYAHVFFSFKNRHDNQ